MGEELNADGSVRFQMRTGNHYRDRWTLADGPQTLEHFDYRVFRYAEELRGLPASVEPEDIKGVGLVYPFDQHGRAYEADASLPQLAHYALDREFALARHSTEYLYVNYTWPTEWKLTSPTAAWRDYLHSGDDI